MTTYVFAMPPSVNNLFLNIPGRGRVPSKGYKAWKEEAGWQLAQQKPRLVTGDVEIHYRFGPRKKSADLENYLKAATDLLVTHGVIEDDSHVTAYLVEWADDVNGTEATVTSATEELERRVEAARLT